MKTVSLILKTIPIGILFFALTGCGSGEFQTYPVDGIITQDGKPLINASVEFYPDGGGGTSYGKTDEQGHFTLEYSSGKKGAIAGKHRVRIIGGTTDPKIAREEIELMEKLDKAAKEGRPLKAPQPKSTSTKDNAPIYVEVNKKGKTQLEIKL
jgi:hypothetical protein